MHCEHAAARARVSESSLLLFVFLKAINRYLFCFVYFLCGDPTRQEDPCPPELGKPYITCALNAAITRYIRTACSDRSLHMQRSLALHAAIARYTRSDRSLYMQRSLTIHAAIARSLYSQRVLWRCERACVLFAFTCRCACASTQVMGLVPPHLCSGPSRKH